MRSKKLFVFTRQVLKDLTSSPVTEAYPFQEASYSDRMRGHISIAIDQCISCTGRSKIRHLEYRSILMCAVRQLCSGLSETLFKNGERVCSIQYQKDNGNLYTTATEKEYPSS